MRISGLAVLSPVHLPRSDLNAIKALLLLPLDDDGRRHLEHYGMIVEVHAFGYFLHTGVVVDDERPSEISEPLWSILSNAEQRGCDWVLIDRDEPADKSLPRFS